MGKKIIALSNSGSKATKQYKDGAQLRAKLEQADFFVWGQFEGSVSMPTTLGRLMVTDLLVTVATSSQWLAKLVGCPSLLIPGPLPPRVLGPELVVDKIQQCQYCYQNHCPQNLNFACMDAPVDQVLAKVLSHFKKH
jgi:ADP-heptose:LPS heptosyltransferase